MQTQPTELTKAEYALVSQLIKPDCQIQVVIPVEINPEKWVEAFSATIKAIDTVYRKSQALHPVLGRLLQVARKNPETYKALGYETFDDFLERAIRSKFEWGRSTCFNVVRMVDRWPDLTNQDYQDIGIANFNVLAAVIPKGDENKTVAKKLLAAAKTSTVSELKALTVREGLSEEGAHDGATFQITCSKAQLRVFCAFFGDADIQAVCQSADKAVILELAIAECTAEWKNSAAGVPKKASTVHAHSPEVEVLEEEAMLA